MTLFLREREVESLLKVAEAVPMVETAIREQGLKEAMVRPRQIVKTKQASVSVLPAAIPSLGNLGFKTYSVSPEGARFWLLLFDERGVFVSLMEAEEVGRIRTGAATGVATRYMSRPESSVAAILGTGHHAPAQLEAICAVRPIERVVAWSRTPANVERFCVTMQASLGIPVEPAPSAEACVRDADIVTTITSSMEPVLCGEWLRPGTHVNLVGAMKPSCREADTVTLQRADLLVVDNVAQAHDEAGEFIVADAARALDWSAVRELSEVVASERSFRKSPESITLFKSHGIGLWDIAVAGHIYRRAVERGVGTRLPIDQDPVFLGAAHRLKA